MEKLSSYPKIYNFGHREVKEIFSTPVLIEEKVDGSQFSFGVNQEGELLLRSKGKQMEASAPEKMFSVAVKWCEENKDKMRVGWVYRGEYLQKPKHNTLHYSRTPINNIVLFDVTPLDGSEDYFSYEEKAEYAKELGLEVVPKLAYTKIESAEELKDFLNTYSFLSDDVRQTKIEGVVVKNYSLLTQADKKPMFAKYVSEAFKESHSTSWKISNPTRSDIVQNIIDTYKVEARWRKAVQHLKESGVLENSPRDIGNLIREVNEDILKEEEENIKEALFKHFWKEISRGVTRGLPEWWKDTLLEEAFDDK